MSRNRFRTEKTRYLAKIGNETQMFLHLKIKSGSFEKQRSSVNTWCYHRQFSFWFPDIDTEIKFFSRRKRSSEWRNLPWKILNGSPWRTPQESEAVQKVFAGKLTEQTETRRLRFWKKKLCFSRIERLKPNRSLVYQLSCPDGSFSEQ